MINPQKKNKNKGDRKKDQHKVDSKQSKGGGKKKHALYETPVYTVKNLVGLFHQIWWAPLVPASTPNRVGINVVLVCKCGNKLVNSFNYGLNQVQLVIN